MKNIMRVSRFKSARPARRHVTTPNRLRIFTVILLLLQLRVMHALALSANTGNSIGCEVATLAGTPLFITLSADKALPGTTFTLTVMVGTETAPVVELFGVGFELHYTATPHIGPVTPITIQPGIFLEPDTYHFIRHEPQNHIIYLAISRKRGAPGQSGHGEVLSLPFAIAEKATPGTKICFVLRNIVANDSTGRTIALEPGPQVCLTVDELQIEVVPNPFTPNNDDFNDEVEFKREGGIPPDWIIRIMDRAGRTVRLLTNGANLWDGRDEQRRKAAPGAYLYTISNGERMLKRGVIALVR